MSECLMCTIIARGPAFTFYDDDDFVAFLALHPLNRGRALLAPKLHVHWIWDHPRIGAYFELAARIATAMTKSFATDWITGVQLGADPPHAHTALVPRYEGDGHGSVSRFRPRRAVSGGRNERDRPVDRRRYCLTAVEPAIPAAALRYGSLCCIREIGPRSRLACPAERSRRCGGAAIWRRFSSKR